jgi:hypothetical protein
MSQAITINQGLKPFDGAAAIISAADSIAPQCLSGVVCVGIRQRYPVAAVSLNFARLMRLHRREV